MLKPTFSTVSCSEWTLPLVAERAQSMGFEAVELRTFGTASRFFACDPALTSDTKIRRMFHTRGIEIASLATSCRFDEPVYPPVVGYLITDHQRSIREAEHAIDLAVALEIPLIRVFAFEYPARERPAAAIKRILGRLNLVLDHAEKKGVRVVIENGGSFASAAQIKELIDASGHQLLGASYNFAQGCAAGDTPERAVEQLADKLWLARVKNTNAGLPAPIDAGELPAERFVRSLAAADIDAPLIYEWDGVWTDDLAIASHGSSHVGSRVRQAASTRIDANANTTAHLSHAAQVLFRWITPQRQYTNGTTPRVTASASSTRSPAHASATSLLVGAGNGSDSGGALDALSGSSNLHSAKPRTSYTGQAWSWTPPSPASAAANPASTSGPKHSGPDDIEDIEGIGPVIADRLRAIGLRSVADLRQRGRSDAGRSEICTASKKLRAESDGWVAASDLFRVPAMTPDWAELLAATGVMSVPQLATASASSLLPDMEARNIAGAKRISLTMPTIDQLHGFIDQAAKLPMLIDWSGPGGR